jgi:hypothetical protein
MAEMLVRHQRKKCAAVAIHAFTDGARDFVVRPAAQTGFRVRCEVRCGQLPGEVLEREHHARAGAASCGREASLGEVVIGVTKDAAGNGVRQILATRQAPGRAVKCTLGCGPDSRAQERTPANRKRNADQQCCDDNENRHADDFPTSCHASPSLPLIFIAAARVESLPPRAQYSSVRADTLHWISYGCKRF